jgi:hypothetical protein
MRTKTIVLGWGRRLRRAWDLVQLIGVAALYLLRNRASRLRWQAKHQHP